MPSPDADALLSADEVARSLRAERSTIIRWARSGDLPGHKLPGKTGSWVFRAGDVEAHRSALIARLEAERDSLLAAAGVSSTAEAQA